MNKTVTINISGIVYHIDENAYEKLAQYLESLRIYFEKEQSAHEILEDIEARISELLQLKIKRVEQVVSIADVEEIISIMGTPEDFGAEAESGKDSESEPTSSQQKEKKRIYRDVDNKVIGGVCTGIGHYFNIDPVLVRIAFIFTFFFSGPLLYLIAWIAIPSAGTTEQKINMRGQNFDIEDIKERVKNEYEDVKDRFTRYGAEAKEKYSSKEFKEKFKKEARYHKEKAKQYGERVKSSHNKAYSHINTPVSEVFAKIFSVFFSILLVVILLSVFTDYSFGFIWGQLSHIPDYISQTTVMFFKDADIAFRAEIAIFGILFLPIISILWGGLLVILGLQTNIKTQGAVIGILWLVVIVCSILTGVKVSKEFDESEKVKVEYSYVADSINSIIISQNDFDSTNNCVFNNNDKIEISDWVFSSCNDSMKFAVEVDLDVVHVMQDSITVVVKTEAFAKNEVLANEIARSLQFQVDYTDSIINIPKYILPQDGQKWRSQEIKVLVKVPEKIAYKRIENGVIKESY